MVILLLRCLLAIGIILNPIRAIDDDANNNRTYLVNTPGCRMAALPVINDEIRQYIFSHPSFKCAPLFTTSNQTHLWIAMDPATMLREYNTHPSRLSCQWMPLIRNNDHTTIVLYEYAKTFRYADVLRIDVPFVKIECFDIPTLRLVHFDYDFFADTYMKPHVMQRRSDPNKMNVMVLGIDAISRLNLHRQMPKTAGVLLNELDAIEMYGYNKVEDNTFPNLIPVLSGMTVPEFDADCIPIKDYEFDDCPLVWKKYQARGYQTAFGEDTGLLGLFNYCRGGFLHKPTNFFMRPIIRQMELDNEHMRWHASYMCLGARRTVDLMMDYMDKFLWAIQTLPYFALFWSSSYTHDYLNMPQQVDDVYAEYLSKLRRDGLLNNTFLIVFSDHGIRYGLFRNTFQGQIEECQPFMFVIPPDWFRERYPLATANLLANRNQLTTPFDLHVVLNDLLDHQNLTDESVLRRTEELLGQPKIERGLSWFLPVSEQRTCADAGIAEHWCTCQDSQPLPVKDPRVANAATFLVAEINRMLNEHPQCAKLSLSSISHASFAQTAAAEDVAVNFQTSPGNAQFEGTVRLIDKQRVSLAGTISRTNMYGDQSHCIDEYWLKLYCFCNDLVEKGDL